MSAPGTDIPPSASDFAIAVVNYNARAHLRACLATAIEAGPRQVVVVDNASSDGSADMVREEFRGVVIHANQDNRGYGAAANQAVAACSSRYVLVLNADTLLTSRAPAALAEYLDAHPRVAVAGPRLVNPDGSLQPSCHAFPTAATILVELTPLARLAHALRPVPGLGELHPPAGTHDRARRVDWVKGAALAIRREAFDQVGGFDESFFMYWEETDLCYRLVEAGWQTHFAPVATIVHAGEVSTGQRRAEMAFQFLQGLRLFSARHHTRRQRMALALALLVVLRLRVAYDLVRLRMTRDPVQRRWLTDSLAGWRRALHGS
jgi:GT2 family glycosyltransferase